MLRGTISDGLANVTAASNDLTTVASLPALGSDSVSLVPPQGVPQSVVLIFGALVSERVVPMLVDSVQHLYVH